jgi:hypothetical protein
MYGESTKLWERVHFLRQVGRGKVRPPDEVTALAKRDGITVAKAAMVLIQEVCAERARHQEEFVVFRNLLMTSNAGDPIRLVEQHLDLLASIEVSRDDLAKLYDTVTAELGHNVEELDDPDGSLATWPMTAEELAEELADWPMTAEEKQARHALMLRDREPALAAYERHLAAQSPRGDRPGLYPRPVLVHTT